jgi:hypothetical protein
MFNPKRFSRRSLLKGASATALLPLLEADIARADCIPAGRKRLIVMHWGNGLNGVGPQGSVNLSTALPAQMSALEQYKSDLLVPEGLHNKVFDDHFTPTGDQPAPGHDHIVAMLIGQAMPTSAYNITPAPTESLDYLIGHRLQQSINSPYPVINLGVMYSPWVASAGGPAWEAPGINSTPDDDPYHVFDQLFTGQPMGDPAVEQRRLRRQSVLDYVQKDIARFSKKLGTADRQKVDGHLSAIREMEMRLTPPMGSGMCATPTLPPMFDIHSSDNYDRTLTAQIDNGVAALAAGLSQVLTLHATSSCGCHYVPTWLGIGATGTQSGIGGDVSSHHGIAHGLDGPDAKNAIDTWFCQKVAYLVGKLKGVPEGGGTMFDNSVVLVTNVMWADHVIYNLPWFLIGSAGGFFKTGQVLATNDASHTGLLIGLANAFGVSTAGWVDANYGGELPGLRA